MNVRQDFANVNGTRLYVESTSSGRAVVLIHGFTLDSRMWDDQFLPLTQHFQVIRYDLRGFGRSAVPTAEPYSHEADLGGLLDQLGVVQAHLVGLSKGGAVALNFALTYPTSTASLVLIDTVLPGYSWSAAGAARDELVWQRASEGGIPAAKESWLAHPLFAPAMVNTAVATRLSQIIHDYSGWHFVNQNNELGLNPPAAQRLPELALPLLAIVGELDLPDFRGITAQICQGVPKAQQLILPGVGHMANMEAPAEVTQAITTFLLGL